MNYMCDCVTNSAEEDNDVASTCKTHEVYG